MRNITSIIAFVVLMFPQLSGQNLKVVEIEGNCARFMVVGDTHHYSPSLDFSQSMLWELTLAAIEEEVDFIFFPGDLIIRRIDPGVDEDSVLSDWHTVLDTLNYHNIKYFACRGNNDAGSGETWNSLFSDNYSFPQNGPENEKNLTYAIEYENLLFIALDQYTEYHKINQVWLDDILANNNTEHIFAAGHEPAFKLINSNCMAAFPEERDLFWESLTDAGAKAYFCGHDHLYDHSIIDDGDDFPENDIHQLISGTGGALIGAATAYNGDNGRWIPERVFQEAENGYVVVELSGSEVKMIWKHRLGQHMFENGGDSFTFSASSSNNINLTAESNFLSNHPNPFHSSTVIKYLLTEISDIELSIWDLSGRQVRSSVNENQQPGSYEVEWDASGMKSGVYFCELKTGTYNQILKIIHTD